MSKTLCCRVNETKTNEHVETALVDSKGRKIGYSVSRYSYDYAAVPEGQTWGARECEPGTREYAGHVQPTRDGASFGAYTPTCYASTESDRDAMIAKKLETGIARYRKLTAKV